MNTLLTEKVCKIRYGSNHICRHSDESDVIDSGSAYV